MMKRRNFLKTAGVASVLLSAGSLMAFNRFPIMEDQKFTPEELKTALDTYFTDVMGGKNFNSNILPPNGKFMVVRSYSIEINNQKNNIFDVADQVIEQLKKLGFDASSLKNGKIPEGMMVRTGIVDLPDRMFPVKIEALKNYDATIHFFNTKSISTNILPKDWIKLTDLEKEEYPNGVTSFKSDSEGKKFNLIGRKNSDKIIDFRFNVEEINPTVKISDLLPNIVSFDFFSTYFTKEQSEQFNF